MRRPRMRMVPVCSKGNAEIDKALEDCYSRVFVKIVDVKKLILCFRAEFSGIGLFHTQNIAQAKFEYLITESIVDKICYGRLAQS